MNRIVSILLLTLLVVSCKHQQVTKTDGPPGFGNTPPARKDAMTAGKANEEETFVQGCIEKSLGNTRKAMGEFQECLIMNPKNAAANYELAALYNATGQQDRALKYAKAAVDNNPDNRWYRLRYAELLMENGQQDESIAVFKTLTEKEPDNVDLLFRYGNSLSNAGHYDDALKTYDHIEQVAGWSDSLLDCRVNAYKQKGDAAGEEKTLQDMIAAFPGNSSYYEQLAAFYETSKQPDKATEVYGKMILKFPSLVLPYLHLAASYQASGQHDKAFEEAAKGFESPGAVNEKATLIKTWYPVSDSSPALSATMKKEADSLCRAFCRVDPDNAQPFALSGDYLFADGKLKEARGQYRKAVAFDENQYAIWMRILYINDKLGDAAAQEKECNDVTALFPTQPDAYYYLGTLYYSEKEYKKAITNLEAAKDYTYDLKREAQLKIMLVPAYRATGNDGQADDYCEDVISKDSSDLKLIASYCASLSERKTKLYNAEKMMLGVVKKEPGNASYLETLGWIEYQLGDYNAAANWMGKAIATSPKDARINERMGDINYKLGKTDLALKFWKTAKENGGSNASLEEKIRTKKLPDNE